MQPVIIGTAGHIDHGKTALVKALTGTDTDRLKEEKERGITIELGYAFLTDQIAFIDVPGHERFIKTMVAGVATVDFALLVVAADDGIMPQTREHFDILNLLGVSDGVIALTKCDLVEEEWMEMVEEELGGLTAGTFLDGRPIIRVDSLSGRGIEDLRQALIELAGQKKPLPPGSIFRLPVDRVFSVKGFGTVVTGSALSGRVGIDDRLVLLPRGQILRVRGIETHGATVTEAGAGMRVALNLPQVSVEEISRGDVLATPDRMRPTFMLDVELTVLMSSPTALEQRQRVRLHIGTKEVMARAVVLESDRIAPGETGLVQLRLEAMTAAERKDRFVIRRYSPPITMGGGHVLDANPEKHRKRHGRQVVEALRHLGDDRVGRLLETMLVKEQVLAFDDLVVRSGLAADVVEEEVGSLCVDGRVLELEAKNKRYVCAASLYGDFSDRVVAALDAHHQKNPLRSGAKRSEVQSRVRQALPDFLEKHFWERLMTDAVIVSRGDDIIARAGFEVSLSANQKSALGRMASALKEGNFQPPGLPELAALCGMGEEEARRLIQLLVDDKKVIILEGKMVFHADAVDQGIARLKQAFEKAKELSMSEFRELLGTSRKFALPLLNYYDNQGYTARRGDVRVRGPKL